MYYRPYSLFSQPLILDSSSVFAPSTLLSDMKSGPPPPNLAWVAPSPCLLPVFEDTSQRALFLLREFPFPRSLPHPSFPAHGKKYGDCVSSFVWFWDGFLVLLLAAQGIFLSLYFSPSRFFVCCGRASKSK